MRLLLLIILVLIGQSTYAQIFILYKGDTINRTDRAGLKQGKWIGFYTDSTITETGKYLNSKKHGIWKKFLPNGQIQSMITYKNDQPDGWAKFYYDNGKLAEEGIWRLDKWVGTYRFFYENGALYYEWNYSDQGKREGEQKYYHANGNLMIEGTWTEGKEQGIIKEYYENGSLKAEKNYANGSIDTASVKEYVQSEEIIVKARDKNMQVEYGAFKGTGKYRLFFKNGFTEKEGYFKEGELIDGKKYYYNADDFLVKIETLLNSRIVKTSIF